MSVLRWRTSQRRSVRSSQGFKGVALLLMALGAVLVTGTASGQLPGTIDLNVAPGTESSPVLRIYGDDPGDQLASNNSNGIAFGDVNGDGFDDMIVGAWRADTAGGSHAGEVYVVYGSASLPATTVDLNTDGVISGAGETRILGDDAVDGAGWSVAAGDVNGDGFDDVIIGAYNADPPGGVHAGEVYVVYGSASLPATVVDLNASPGSNGETRILGDNAVDRTGYSVASGDVNGDGFDDVIVGAYDADPNGNNAGVVYVIYGSASLGGTTLDLNNAPGSNGETRILGDDQVDQAGWSVSVGDVNGDGFDDVIVGAKAADPPGRKNAGEVYVVYGGIFLPGTTVDLNSSPGSNGETRILGKGKTDGAGWSVASGDVNGDGYDDVIVGAKAANPVGGANAGEVFVVYGDASLPGSTVNLSLFPGSNGETRILGDDMNDNAGISVAASDVDGDGFDDVIIGAPRGDPVGGTHAGEVYVVFGGASLPGTTVDLDSVSGDVRVLGDDASDNLGYSSEGGGDVDRDGFSEFAASAFKGGNPSIGGDNNSGYAVTMFGDGTATAATVIEMHRAGAAPRRGMGGRLSPVARTWLSFDAGDNGSGGASSTTVTLTRNDAGITNLGDGSLLDVADVIWQVTSDRIGFGSAEITFQYLDSEIAGIPESGLQLFKAASLTGPWTLAPTQSLDTTRNTITATLSSFSFFAIFGDIIVPSVSSIVAATAGPINAPVVDFIVTFSEDVEGVDTGDFVMDVSGPTGAFVMGVSGSGDTYTVTCNTGSGDGDLSIDVTDDDSILDVGGNRLGGSGIGNGNFTSGEIILVDKTEPTVSAIVRGDASPTNAAFVDFIVTFDESVTGVDSGDFIMDVSGILGASVTGVSGTGDTYTVTVNTGSGDGILSIDVTDDDSILDLAGNPLGGSGAGNGDFTGGAAYIMDRTGPTVSAIVRGDTNPTNATLVDFIVTFGESVTGVNAGDFIMDVSGLTGAFVTGVAGSGDTYTVTANTGTGDGILSIDVTDDDSILDLAGNPLGGSGAGNGDFTSGEAYIVDKTAPAVSSIGAATVSPTNAASVDFIVTFSEDVTGVDTGDFVMDVSGPTGAFVTGVSGSGNTYTVTANTGSGDGDLSIDVTDDDSILDLVGNPLGGSGAGNGNFTSGDTIQIDKTGPTVSAIVRGGASPTNATLVDFIVTFDESVTGVDTGDFILDVGGLTGAFVTGVAGSGDTYTVTANTGSGQGDVSIDVTDDDSILDLAGNPLGGTGVGNGDFTSGETYAIDKNVPIVSMSSAAPDPTNVSPITVVVTFTEPVTGFDALDVIPSNGSIGSFGGAGASYSFDLTPVGQGTVSAAINAGVAEDLAGNPNAPAPPFSRTFDDVAPAVTVDTLTTNDTTPQLTGTVDDTQASVSVSVSSQTLPATNNGDGTWTLADDTLSSLTAGTYDVQVTATDLAGNVGFDATTNELTIQSTSLIIYVDFAAGSPTGAGTEIDPVDSIGGALSIVEIGGVIRINAGSTTETLTISQAVTLELNGTTGSVIIGAPPTRSGFISRGGTQ